MTDTINFKFKGRDESLEIVNEGLGIVGYLATQSAECPLMGSKIKNVRELGKGNFGTAFLIQIEGMGPKEYVAKMIASKMQAVYAGSIAEFVEGMSLGELADILQNKEKYSLSKNVIISLNGNNPAVAVSGKNIIFIPSPYGNICKLKSVELDRLRRFDNNQPLVLPPTVYACSEEQYSEFVIGALCGDLYRKGISINFFDVFGFTTCPSKKSGNVRQYIFMEKMDSTARSLKSYLFQYKADPNYFRDYYPKVLLIQTLHAIATYQDYYQLQHGDLHPDNLFIEIIKSDTVFNGQPLFDVNWFHYHIYGVDLYLPAIPFLVKIADFGLSVKYSEPLVGNKLTLTTGYNQLDGEGPWIPNWYAPSYDAIVVAKSFLFLNQHDAFIKKIFSWMMGFGYVQPSDEMLNDIMSKTFLASGGTRPMMDQLDTRFSQAVPSIILTNPVLMEEFIQKPSNGKIVTLGVLD